MKFQKVLLHEIYTIYSTLSCRCCVPEPRELRRFVSRPPPGGGRLHCTMLRHAGEPAPCYTLYLEYLGGLVPLLKGRRTSKIRPEFVIFDPQSQDAVQTTDYLAHYQTYSDGSDTERDTADLCGSPRNRRKNRRRREEKPVEETDDLAYVDTLPEVGKNTIKKIWQYLRPCRSFCQMSTFLDWQGWSVLSFQFVIPLSRPILAREIGGGDVKHLGNKVQNPWTDGLGSS